MQCQCGGLFEPVCNKCEANNWIDVKEKTPERGVFLTTDGISYEICLFAGAKFIPKSCKISEFNVAYWMELPELPPEHHME